MPANELQRLLPRHYRIVDLALLGMDTREIADEMGMTPQGIGLIMNSARVQEELARRRADIEGETKEVYSNGLSEAKRLLEESALSAAQSLVELSRGAENEGVRRQSSVDILDRVMEKKGSQSATVVLNVDSLQNLMIALKESQE